MRIKKNDLILVLTMFFCCIIVMLIVSPPTNSREYSLVLVGITTGIFFGSSIEQIISTKQKELKYKKFKCEDSV